ncbi:GNAT family N-acetyltransferase [Planctomonas psychrotolerans]|uniref:GNAT family N-acetyltransferase n=1 Tax=Planctomonas psychrotolerans TaxID=2528712 RepID=UPI001D0D608F|nr:GNAT family protein [Planctomonas psychrotolerans]
MRPPSVELRPLRESDVPVLVGWEADEVFCAHARWRPHRPYAEATAWWRDRIVSPDPFLLRLLAVSNGVPVGYADLHGDEPDARELGYLIAPSARWGEGLGTATARAALARAFGDMRLHRVWAEAVEANAASVQVLRRLGMRETGVGNEESFLGQPSRYVRFELLREEWETTRQRVRRGVS